MLDATVIKRDARACMMDWPVTIRHFYDPDVDQLYHEVTAAFSRADQITMLEPGGLLDKASFSVFFIAGDLVPLPKTYDRVDLLMNDGVTWERFVVNNTPDNNDPLAQFYELNLGSEFN